MTEENTTESTRPSNSHAFRWREQDLFIIASMYAEDDALALVIVDALGNPYTKASVNLRRPLTLGHVYIKNYSENRGVLDALVSQQLVQDIGKPVRRGSGQFDLVWIKDKLWNALGLEPRKDTSDPDPESDAAVHVEEDEDDSGVIAGAPEKAFSDPDGDGVSLFEETDADDSDTNA